MKTLKRERQRINEYYQKSLTASLLVMIPAIILAFFNQYWMALLMLCAGFIETVNAVNYLEIRNEFDKEIGRRRRTWTT